MGRRTLDSAHKGKKDEFYTQYEDVEREVTYYLDFNGELFKDKVVLCPCDDGEESSFTVYFAQNFEKLGLKKLITTTYVYPPDEEEKEESNPEVDRELRAKVFTLEKEDGAERADIKNIKWKYLKGNGDFRSREMTALRDEADFIITNPPFSLFREFIAWIMEAGKKFLILGNQNAITYKDVFPLIKDNEIWLGCRFNERVNGKNLTYRVPDYYEMNACELFVSEKGEKFITVPGTGWFTNIDHGKRHQPLALMTMADNIKFSKHKEIRENGYKKYDNYDAIDIPFVDAIPSDYMGAMGVPITFLGKYCPEQFQILKFRKGDDEKDLSVGGKCPYFRILIRKKEK